MVEQHNGQRDQAKPKRYTAKLLSIAIRERIVNALANGDSQRAIARNLHVSPNTVSVVAEQEWTRVEARKGRIAAQAERAATLAADRILSKLESADDIALGSLVPVFGVSVDKLTALRGDVSLTLRHEHFHAHAITGDDLIGFAVALSNARAKNDEELHQRLLSLGPDGFGFIRRKVEEVINAEIAPNAGETRQLASGKAE